MEIIKIFFCIAKDEGLLPYHPRGVMPPGWVPPVKSDGSHITIPHKRVRDSSLRESLTLLCERASHQARDAMRFMIGIKRYTTLEYGGLTYCNNNEVS